MNVFFRREPNLPLINIPRMLWVAAELGLIAFSSTAFAAIASEYAYHFYGDLLGLGGTTTGIHMLAQKGVHFVLFFALGSTLFHSINIARFGRVVLVAAICLSAGIGSEGLQLLIPGRHASVADVVLNGSSGTLAVLLSLRGF